MLPRRPSSQYSIFGVDRSHRLLQGRVIDLKLHRLCDRGCLCWASRCIHHLFHGDPKLFDIYKVSVAELFLLVSRNVIIDRDIRHLGADPASPGKQRDMQRRT